MEKTIDVRLFKSVVHFYSFTGTFPYLTKSKKIFLILYNVIGLTSFVKVCLETVPVQNLSTLSILFYSTNIAASLAFSLLCLSHLFVHETLWNDVIAQVEAFDSTMENLKIILVENRFKYYLKIIIGTVLIFVLFLSILLASSKTLDLWIIIATSYYILMNTQILITTLAVDKLLIIVEKRCEFLKRQIKKTFLFPNAFERDESRTDRTLKALYLLLVNMVATINRLFGHRILLAIIMVFNDVLSGIQYIFLEDRNSVYIRNSFSIFLKMAISLVSIILIHMILIISYH